MANTVLTADIIAAEAIDILENNCVMGDLVYRGYEEEFNNKVNGYSVGDTISVRRPTDFTVRDGATASIQDAVEGKFSLAVDKQKGVDFKFTSSDLTLRIDKLSERIIKPAMVQLANQIDRDLTALYKNVWNWVGMIGNVDTYSSQNIATHTTGDTSSNGTPLTNGSAVANSTTWAVNKNSGIGALITDGWTAAKTLKEGDVFTIATVFAVNPVTKATLPYLQQFVVRADAVADGSGNMTISISPPIITSGAFQTVSGGPADNTAITTMGTAGTGYRQNLVFDKNAFSLVMVPMVKPPGAVDVARKSYKGYSVRVIPYYDGVNDVSNWRLDVLYGVKTVDARLATRLSGS